MSATPLPVLLVPVEHNTHAVVIFDSPAVAGVCPMTGTSTCPTDMDQTEGCTRC